MVRGVWVGGNGNTDLIQYITIATTGNASSFGNTSYSNFNKTSGSSDDTKAVYANGATNQNIEYITVATTGNATSFGNLTGSGSRSAASCGDGVKAVWAGGYMGGNTNIMDYVDLLTF